MERRMGEWEKSTKVGRESRKRAQKRVKGRKKYIAPWCYIFQMLCTSRY